LNVNNLPKEKDAMFYLDKEITVLKVFLEFRFARVEYVQSHRQILVDINALSFFPARGSSISIKLLGGVE